MNITTERFLPECHSTKGFCRITENPADLESADAVLFHNADYSAATVPKPRKLSRPHVLWSLESPSNDFFRPESHVINWTMTFRRDADIWYPYGHFRKLPESANVVHSVTVDYDAIWKIKKATPPAVWLASNCFARNKRTQIVQELEKQGLKVAALKYDYRPYKFYIALENSNCVDYVTEKFYQTLISRVAIPIVLKRDIYLNVGVPKDSFIAIDDFPTIADLVRYVHEVADDKEKYLSYHRWRETYE
ncbi:unnamed protein product [Heligmosomoides polygyrus]|uniref:Fucosyltransferase n=1 Tax=Heligmosomoides polygyrus TaxID=6339 RepID=A0A183FHA6_HELPZ|nr:unnamed protein product [Heligmosomoides polygyrus]